MWVQLAAVLNKQRVLKKNCMTGDLKMQLEKDQYKADQFCHELMLNIHRRHCSSMCTI